MGVYTTKEYIKKLQKMATLNIKPFYEITQEVIDRQQKRIFDKGIDGNGGRVGSYNNDPIYVSNRSEYTPRRNKPVGNQRNQSKFKNGKSHKSTYFPGGYGEFKKAVGKGSGSGGVNLWLFGNLRKGFMASGGKDNITIGNSRVKIIKSIRSSANNPQGKLDFIFAEYPNAFRFTKGERGFVLKRFREIFLQQLQK